MSESVEIGGHKKGLAMTLREDAWWIAPFLTILGLGCFAIYATWAAFQGQYYYTEPYLSPFYSPLVYVDTNATGSAPLHHSLLGSWPSWWPAFLPPSPAFFILIFPALFRGTCYYYRKAYYRSFFGTPPGCAVGAVPQNNYKGETSFFLFQNLHRYALYIAIGFIFILAYDALMAFFKNGQIGIGVGTIVLCINVALLSAYTFGCHSWRHLVGGKEDCFSNCTGSEGKDLSYKIWQKVTCLNSKHMKFAWLSLFWVGFTDFYVRMVSMGYWFDWNTWN